jgi:hypothetical protein
MFFTRKGHGMEGRGAFFGILPSQQIPPDYYVLFPFLRNLPRKIQYFSMRKYQKSLKNNLNILIVFFIKQIRCKYLIHHNHNIHNPVFRPHDHDCVSLPKMFANDSRKGQGRIIIGRIIILLPSFPLLTK